MEATSWLETREGGAVSGIRKSCKEPTRRAAEEESSSLCDSHAGRAGELVVDDTTGLANLGIGQAGEGVGLGGC